MDEVYRVLEPEGKATFLVPYYSSMRCAADFFSEWPPISEFSFLYFNRKWREDNKAHPELKCDFDFNYGYTVEQDVASRNQETQAVWIKRNINTVQDLHVNLVKRKAGQ
jgi:hypothetical protein